MIESLPIRTTFVLVLVAIQSATGETPPAVKKTPEIEKAVKYLVQEVPRWSRENHCFSCHNNGDAARALFEARRRGFIVPDPALSDTLTFLSHPDRWDKNGVDAEFSDKRLARLQFAVALASGIETEVIADRSPLEVATRQLIKDQAADGSWPIDDEALIGSPATYGKPLATALAIRVLAASDRQHFAEPIQRAEQWLRARPIQNVLDACAALMLDDIAPGSRLDPKLRDASLDLLRNAQSDDGGWGPFTNASPEVFDTALVLISLANRQDQASLKPMLARGRAYLISQQADDGSWPETTRPSGSESYAQRLSTTGWATLALLLTE